MECDRIWPTGKMKLISAAQARSFFKRDDSITVSIECEDGMHSVKVLTDENQEFMIGKQDFSTTRRWITRDKAITFVCRNFGISENMAVNIEFKKSEGKKK